MKNVNKHKYDKEKVEDVAKKLTAVMIAAYHQDDSAISCMPIDAEAIGFAKHLRAQAKCPGEPVAKAVEFYGKEDGSDYVTNILIILKKSHHNEAISHSDYHYRRRQLREALAYYWILENEASSMSDEEWLKSDTMTRLFKDAKKLYQEVAGNPYCGGTHKVKSSLSCNIKASTFYSGLIGIEAEVADAYGRSRSPVSLPLLHKGNVLIEFDRIVFGLRSELSKLVRATPDLKAVSVEG